MLAERGSILTDFYETDYIGMAPAWTASQVNNSDSPQDQGGTTFWTVPARGSLQSLTSSIHAQMKISGGTETSSERHPYYHKSAIEF